jgi:translation initiation factor 4E
MEYPLNDTWCVYFHAKNAGKKYSDNTTKLIEFNNIEYFWRTFNNIPKPTDMFSEPGVHKKILKSTGEIPNAISLFRKNSYPSWEDPTNIKGFEWSIKKYKDFDHVNYLWTILTTKTVGENFDHSEILNGVRIVDSTIDYKIMYRVELWFSDKKYKEYFETKIKDILEIPQYTKLLYREHSTLKETKPNKNILPELIY